MKKLILLLAIPAVLASCGGETEEKKEEKKEEKDKGPDIDAMAKEYCGCMDIEGLEEMSSCLEDFQKKYEGVEGNDDQKKEFEEAIKKHCGDDM